MGTWMAYASRAAFVLVMAVLFETVMAYRTRIMARSKPDRVRLLGLVMVECTLWAVVIRLIVLDVAVVPWYAAGAVAGVMLASFLGTDKSTE